MSRAKNRTDQRIKTGFGPDSEPSSGAAPRLVSLVPSITETLQAWDITPVACTRFCEQPKLTHVGGTKNPDIEAIVALAPDLVVMEREENRMEDYQALSEQGIAIEVLHVTSLEEAQTEIARLADRLGEEFGASIPPAVAAPSVQLADSTMPVDPGLANTVLANPALANTGLTAFIPIWRKPWMTINRSTYAVSLLNALGVRTAFAHHPQRYPTISEDDILATSPDLVLAPTEPYPFAKRHLAELQRFAPAHLLDGQDLFWWGARTPAAFERLTAAVADIAHRLLP